MNIRKAKLEDIDNNLLNIYIDGFRFHLNGRRDIFSDKSDEELKEELEEKVSNTDSIIIAEDNKKIAGFIIFQIKDKATKALWIDQLVVDKLERSKGIAKALIQEINEIAKKENCVRVELCCRSFNDNAKEMYEHLGFENQRVILDRKVI